MTLEISEQKRKSDVVEQFTDRFVSSLDDGQEIPQAFLAFRSEKSKETKDEGSVEG